MRVNLATQTKKPRADELARRCVRAQRRAVPIYSASTGLVFEPGISVAPISPYIRQPSRSSHVFGRHTGIDLYVSRVFHKTGECSSSRQPSKLSPLENGSIFQLRATCARCSP